MDTQCAPPRCHKTKRGCRCPNPWIEYLAKIAHDRRDSQKKPLSIKQTAKSYKGLKARKKFDGVNQSCRHDTELLCRWNTERIGRYSEKLHKIISTDFSLLPHFPLDPRNNIKPDWFCNSIAKHHFFRTVFPCLEHLLPNFQFAGILCGSKNERDTGFSYGYNSSDV